jgi:hypothetical protein
MVNIKTCTLRVPDDAGKSYQKASVWKKFGKIESI